MREFDAGIDWVYEGKKDTLPLDYACKLLHWKDAYSWPEISHLKHSFPEWKKTYNLAVASINAKTLWHTLVRGKPWVRRREFFLEWAPAKGFTTHPELAGILSPRPAENGDLTPPKPQKETPGERSARLKARHQELTAAGDPHPTKTVAEEEGISVSRVWQLMNRKAKTNGPSPTRPR